MQTHRPHNVRRTVRRLALGIGVLTLPLAVGACQSLGVNETPKSDPSMGLLIAENSCSRCHLTGGGGASPNPAAPTFADIVNRPGMTQDKLIAWLRDGHNYPVEMGFHLEPHQVESLATYMIRRQSSESLPGN